MSVTIQDVADRSEAVGRLFGKNAHIGWPQVSMTQLSTARYYGSATVNGNRFLYNPADDSLIRADVVKFVEGLMRDERKAAKQAEDAKQGEMKV